MSLMHDRDQNNEQNPVSSQPASTGLLARYASKGQPTVSTMTEYAQPTLQQPVTPVPSSAWPENTMGSPASPSQSHSLLSGKFTQSFQNNPISESGIITSPSTNNPISEPGILNSHLPSTLVFSPEPTRNPGEAGKDVQRVSPRKTVIIRGNGKKSSGLRRPPAGRRGFIHVSVVVLLAIASIGVLFIVLPTGTGGLSSNLLGPGIAGNTLVRSKDNNTGMVAPQAATATAVTQDGFDPGAGAVFEGVPSAPVGVSGTGNHFFYGQCTYWASMRYYTLTGRWVPWLGNAKEWSWRAGSYGWMVSSSPHMHSIIVLQQYVQGAGWYGHVAIVEGINPDGSVRTSNWNWGPGGWAQLSYVTFRPGSGVSFVWYPGD